MLDSWIEKPDEMHVLSDERKPGKGQAFFRFLHHLFCLNYIVVHVNFRNSFGVF